MANILITPAKANKPEELQRRRRLRPVRGHRRRPRHRRLPLDLNPNYWGAPAITPQVRPLPGGVRRVVALRSGEIDVIDTISPDAIGRSGLPGVDVETPGTRLTQLFYNFRKPPSHPLADPRVREALSYAIDGESLINDVCRLGRPGRGRRAARPWPGRQDRRVRLRPRQGQADARAGGVRTSSSRSSGSTGEFASDTAVMEAVAEMLRPSASRRPPAVRTRRRHHAGGRARRRLGRPRQRLRQPDRAGPHHAAGHVRAAPRRRRRPATPTTATSSPRSPR